MRAGKLKYSVIIQQRSTGVDPEYGGQLATWTDFATVWCAIESVSGVEQLSASAVQNEGLVNVTMHYRSDIVAGMRLLRGAIVYDIHHVPTVPNQHCELVLRCATGMTKG